MEANIPVLERLENFHRLLDQLYQGRLLSHPEMEAVDVAVLQPEKVQVLIDTMKKHNRNVLGFLKCLRGVELEDIAVAIETTAKLDGKPSSTTQNLTTAKLGTFAYFEAWI